jgi:hypothetical protein
VSIAAPARGGSWPEAAPIDVRWYVCNCEITGLVGLTVF